MIKLKLLLEGRYDYGCVMAIVDEEFARKILDFNYDLIDEDSLYKKGKDFGREQHCHVTVKYGLTKSYSETQIKRMLKDVSPFKLKITGLSLFENEDFDVVKFDVKCKELEKLNEKLSKLPNEDSYPDYHPHLTLAYVKKGLGKKFVKKNKTFSNVPINYIQYSDAGDKSYYNL
jgi:2'-5' RNA ligase